MSEVKTVSVIEAGQRLGDVLGLEGKMAAEFGFVQIEWAVKDLKAERDKLRKEQEEDVDLMEETSEVQKLAIAAIQQLTAERDQLRARVEELEDAVHRHKKAGWGNLGPSQVANQKAYDCDVTLYAVLDHTDTQALALRAAKERVVEAAIALMAFDWRESTSAFVQKGEALRAALAEVEGLK